MTRVQDSLATQRPAFLVHINVRCAYVSCRAQPATWITQRTSDSKVQLTGLTERLYQGIPVRQCQKNTFAQRDGSRSSARLDHRYINGNASRSFAVAEFQTKPLIQTSSSFVQTDPFM